MICIARNISTKDVVICFIIICIGRNISAKDIVLCFTIICIARNISTKDIVICFKRAHFVHGCTRVCARVYARMITCFE